MPLVKTASIAVRTAEGYAVSLSQRDNGVLFTFEDGLAVTFLAEDLRAIADEFAPKQRKPRGPNKRTTAGARNGQGAESRTSAA